MAQMSVTLHFHANTKLAWAVAYALMPFVFVRLISADKAASIAARFVRITTSVK